MTLNLADISHFDFFEQLDKYAAEIEAMLESPDIEAVAVIDFKTFANTKITAVKEHVSKYIEPDASDILSLLQDHCNNVFDIDYSLYGFDKEPEIKKEIDRLEGYRRSLKSMMKYLSIIDTLFDKTYKNHIETIIDKNDFILDKLNGLFDDHNYSVSLILSFNGIGFRNGEPREIAEDLAKRGYVILERRYGESDHVKISVKGASYIERKNKQRKNSQAKNELDKKIDNILEHLTKLGYGQEIIFNEIDELRGLQHKISKKTWSQLLKGKLLDLTLDKLINMETAASIYEYLTSNSFRLLKQ
ncbi:hypothetical protein [Parapedobacter sp. DT-150]|uniref:hypothetical protein n=1 Tax=Parapedobacter sp. DT-150 TaxID=3396162 RepID=UPI003F1B8F68